MRRLPIGIQDFTKLRDGGYVYVDKTANIHRLITGSGAPFFLSRPRRFGKSLLCSTLEAVFEGKRELFKSMEGQPALAIDSLEWEWKKHPVIKLDLNAGVYSKGAYVLNEVLSFELQSQAKKLGLELKNVDINSQFKWLIQDAREKYGERTVVIIDEYDKPLLETMDCPELHIELRNALKGFYGILKSSDAHLQFVFITGVTKFSQVTIFSDLNNLVDITLNTKYADICGITQEEMEANFEPEIAAILVERNRTREEYMENLRTYYNGYRFSEKNVKVYNSFGLLNHFEKGGRFDPYWYETGTPTFLVKLITKQKIDITNLGKMQLKYEDLRKFDIENMDAVPVLYQSGYLTITDYDEDSNSFYLDYPNVEVRSSFASSLLNQYMQVSPDISRALIMTLPNALRNGNIEEAIDSLRQYMASVPYDIIKNTENYYQTVVHLTFSMLGLNCRSEIRIASGRIDTLVETKNFVYCFEFKIENSARLAEACEEALTQIDTKDYLLPWTGSNKKLFKVGVVFDTEKRNIGEWRFVSG